MLEHQAFEQHPLPLLFIFYKNNEETPPPALPLALLKLKFNLNFS